MPTDVVLPKAGLTADEAVVVEWVIPQGGSVNEGDVVVLVETDKAMMEVCATSSGVLEPAVADGVRVAAGSVLARIWGTHEIPPETSAAPLPLVDSGDQAGATDKAAPYELATSFRSSTPRPPAPLRGDWWQLRASMAARAQARQLGLALEGIVGSGPGGRVVRVDVERTAAMGASFVPDQAQPPAARVVLAGRRRAIAEHLEMARDRCVPLTVNRFANCGGLIRLRRTLVNASPETPPTLTECAAVVVARVLTQHMTLNGTITQDGSGVELNDQITLGVAVDTDEGLVVPTIPNAHLLGVAAFTQELRSRVERARARRSTPADLANGTFTLTNLGQFGIDFGTPVLNWPQVAILGLGRIRGRGGEEEMGLSLTVDHKFIDGVPAARFLQDVAEAFEEPGWVLR